MTSLKTLQNLFQKNILNNNSDIKKYIPPTKTLSASQKIQIYQNSYYERIITAMSQDFPIIKAFLGENAFASLVRDYISHYPSHYFNLRFIGKHLSEFLLQKNKSFAAFSDLAKLEYLMCQTNTSEVYFQSDFNVIEVYNIFHTENKLTNLKEQ